MARDIVLKDKNGNETEHTDVWSIDIPTPTGEVASFLNTDTGTCYYATLEEVDGVNYFTIKLQFVAGHTSRSMYGYFSDALCKDYGKLASDGSYQIYMIFTSKSLTIGETYTEDEL